MTFELKTATKAEQMYAYPQSQQISSQVGCIGHLCADMNPDQNGFLTTWFGRRTNLETDEFKNELYEVIKALRFENDHGGVLKNRDSLQKYCQTHAEAHIGSTPGDFGFRVDTQERSYIFRLNPVSADHNVDCYCYKKAWLDNHMIQAEQGIRFIDSSYNEKFRIPDGGRIRITSPDGRQQDFTCRYIDPYHLEVGKSSFGLYHICEFAEMMDRSGNIIESLDFMPGHEPHDRDNDRRYQIYQLKRTPEASRLRFQDMETAKQLSGKDIEFGNYDLLYQGKLPEGMWLDDLYAKFNLDKPEDFHGYSLSISDIIVVMDKDREQAFYVDSIGFKPIPCPAGRDMQVQEKLNTGERPSLKSALRDKKDLAQVTVKKAVEAAVGKRKREALE